MNILFVHQNFPSQFVHLSKALAIAGYKVKAISLNSASAVASGVETLNYRLERNTTAGIHPWVRDLETKVIRGEACYFLAKQLRISGYIPDLIFFHPGWGESLFLKEVWPKSIFLMYAEYYYHSSGRDVGFDPEFPMRVDDNCIIRSKNFNNELNLNLCDAAVSPTNWQKLTFPNVYQEKIRVIHDGIDTNKVKPNLKVELAITLQNGRLVRLTRKNKIVTFVNRDLEPYRGYHSFMRSLPEILKKSPDAYVLIVGGDGVSYGSSPSIEKYGKSSWKEIFANEVRPLISNKSWEQIIFIGKLSYDQYLEIIQISSVHVYLTYPFILSWSMLEAMSAGCAVVGSKTPPVEEVILHEHNGLLVDFFDYRQLAKSVCDLLEDTKRREELGRAARQTIIERYDLTTVCLPAQLNLIHELADIRHT